MLRSWRRSIETHGAIAVALGLLILASAPADARRGGGPAVAPSPAIDRKVSQKQQAEQLAGRAGAIARATRACLTTAPPGPTRAGLERELAVMERGLQSAAQAYHVGNYIEAVRRYLAVEKTSKTAALACDRIRLGAERCQKSVAAAVERIRAWSLKIARLQDPASRAACEAVYTQTEKDLHSLAATCATTDPLWVANQLPVVLKPLDDAIRKSR